MIVSIAILTLAFKVALPPTQKFVLVALADTANDQGECYPSIPALAEKCSMGVRTVQESVAALERVGALRREFRNGRSTLYVVDPRAIRTTEQALTHAPTAPLSNDSPPQIAHPAPAAPPRNPHQTPAPAAPPPPQIAHPTPADCAPITVKEPSIEPSGNQEKTRARKPETVTVAELVEAGFDEATAVEFIAVKADRKAPLTRRAWQDHCREAAKVSWTPMQAAEKVMAKTWKGFEAKYVADESRSRQQSLEERNQQVLNEMFARSV